jgi:ubiquinone/menaquinone biosynthesis C-methylase UbiE
VKPIDIAKAQDLYNSRFEQYGRDIRTVGWGSVASQELRFEALFRGLDPKSKTILDVGCGLADLVPFLERRTCGDFRYIGIDIAGKLLENAREIHGKKDVEFLFGDIFSLSLPRVDIAVLSGALSLKVDNIETYAQETMRRMYEISNEAACLNYLSKYVDYELQKNQHYQPEQIFSQAMNLTNRVNLYHDYPLHEFTIQLINPDNYAD